MECLSVRAEYDIFIDHARVRETITSIYNGEGLLASESLYPLEGLRNISFSSTGRRIGWEYNASRLLWTYYPPLGPGENLTYTREWVIPTNLEEDGSRYIVLPIPSTPEADLVFRCHNVDIFDSSIPLDATGAYVGNVSSSNHFIRYSSTFKVYEYRCHGLVTNLGDQGSSVSVNVSLPWEGPFQHALGPPPANVSLCEMGNREAHLRFDLEQGARREIGYNLTLVTRTWAVPGPLFPSPVENLSAYTEADKRFWQAEDPRIVAFARDAVRNARDAEEEVGELVAAVSGHLTYDPLCGREGALWALLEGRGSCKEYCDLFVASARSLGIPSLYISGLVGTGTLGSAGHAWAAVHLPEGGWIGVDPTWGRFGPLDSARIVTRLCNPDDQGLSLRYTGGKVTVTDWEESWTFHEITAPEAERLLGIDQRPFWAVALLLAAIIPIHSARTTSS